MPDMRYELRISAHEVLGVSQALIEVFGHPADLRQPSERLVRRLVDVNDAEDPTPEVWARDVCVALAELF